MKSLEDITIERTSKRVERGTNGFTREVENTFKQKLNVKTVNGWLRFVHYLVDYSLIIGCSVGVTLIPGLEMVGGLMYFVMIPLYYTVMEGVFQQTLGKMITGSVVINKYAEKPDFSTCIGRALLRFVPFEPISCLGTPSRGWHDKWVNTYVVKKDEVARLQELLAKHNSEDGIFLSSNPDILD